MKKILIPIILYITNFKSSLCESVFRIYIFLIKKKCTLGQIHYISYNFGLDKDIFSIVYIKAVYLIKYV